MEQMTAPDARIEGRTVLGELQNGFFRKEGNKAGGIFFRYHDSMVGLLFAPVMKNGRVSMTSGVSIKPAEKIEVISQEELGIYRIYWA